MTYTFIAGYDVKMKLRNIKIVVRISFILFIFGCNKHDAGIYIYEPFENIMYTLHTKELKYHSDIKAVFLHFELQIENNSNKEVFLDIEKIQSKLNGVINKETYYDSLASAMPEKEILHRGMTEKKLYFVFPKSLRGEKPINFKVTNFGLSLE